ncbi:MAG: hypothetical protein H7X80_01010 [bacterium]|nr:hypothetical protein [Candidatus Kapabacteria bacterium]
MFAQACSNSVEVAPENCDAAADTLNSNDFVINGGGFSNTVIDLEETVGNSGSYGTETMLMPGNRVELKVDAFPVKIANDSGLVHMTIVLPRRDVGTFPISTSTDAIVQIALVPSSPTGSRLYTGESGTLTVSTYLYEPVDTIAIIGRFCGTFKDSAGQRVTIAGGDFTITSR